VSRNPHDIGLVINFPRLGHTQSDSIFRTRNGLQRFIHENGARGALSEGERSVSAVVATTRSRRRSHSRSDGGNAGRGNGRSSGDIIPSTRLVWWVTCRGIGRSSGGDISSRRLGLWGIRAIPRGSRGLLGTGRHLGGTEPRVNGVPVTIVLGRGSTGNETRWVVGDTFTVLIVLITLTLIVLELTTVRIIRIDKALE
jgi:hypothetical protein